MTQKIKIFNPSLPWVFLCAAYIIFIGFLTYFYPFTVDEFVFKPASLGGIFLNFKMAYGTLGARLGFVPYMFVLYFGKWLFTFLNPVVQLALVYLVFYFIFMRRPDVKNHRDFWVFVLLLIMSVFASAQPDQTLFWMGGAASYSWTFIPFIFALILLRKFLRKEIVLKNVWYIKAVMFACGLVFGLTNENNGPALFILFACAALYLKIIKIKTPSYFYFILAGILGGLVFMFLAPAYQIRMGSLDGQVMSAAGFWQKIFWHLAHFQYMIGINFYILPATALLLFLFALDKGLKIFKNADFLLSFLCLAFSLLLLAPLALAPFKGRLLYSSVWMSSISFIFLIKLMDDFFKRSFLKWCALFAFATAVAFTPSFVFPYYDLHRQELARNAVIEEGTKKNFAFVFVPHFRAAQGPNSNLCVDNSFEPMFRSNVINRKDIYKTDVLIYTDARN